jgi:hypothetical protein
MKAKLLPTFLLFFITGFLMSQTDNNPNTVTNVHRLYGIKDVERSYEQSRTTVQIPQELFVRLDNAKRNNNIAEAEKIQSEIDKYSIGTVKTPNTPTDKFSPAPPPYTPPFNPDWVNPDVIIKYGQISGYNSSNGNRRTIDIKRAKDGYLYIAVATDSTTSALKFLYFYRSTNSGLTWTAVGGIQGTDCFSSVSMTIDRKGSVNDSIRISCYYTSGPGANANDAGVYLYSFRPRAWNDDYRFHTLATPTTGRKFCYVSAVSDGWYYEAATYVGCVVSEVSNNNDSCASLRFIRSTNWGITNTSVTLNGVYTGYWGDFYPSACLKRSKNVYSDSVYIAVERRFSASSVGIRIFTTPWSPATTTVINYLTSATAVYKRPCLTVRQTAYQLPRQIMVTYTKDNVCYYSYSLDDGLSWSLDASLDPHGSTNGFFTSCTSDTLTTTGCFAAVFTTSSDSVSVRRGFPGNLSSGTIQYKLNSVITSGTVPPVTAIFSNNAIQRVDIAFAGTGPNNCWFDAENLPTNIGTPIGTAAKYELAQNYPNPFNPSTSISFSIMKPEFVRLSVYDITGKEISVIVNQQLTSGKYNIDFNASKFSSGVYFYKISAGDFSNVRKMILIK